MWFLRKYLLPKDDRASRLPHAICTCIGANSPVTIAKLMIFVRCVVLWAADWYICQVELASFLLGVSSANLFIHLGPKLEAYYSHVGQLTPC